MTDSFISSREESLDAGNLADGSAGRVGLVAGTEDSTPLQFAVALDETSYLQLDDVVVTLRHIPGVGPVLDQWHCYGGSGQARGCEFRLGCLPYF